MHDAPPLEHFSPSVFEPAFHSLNSYETIMSKLIAARIVFGELRIPLLQQLYFPINEEDDGNENGDDESKANQRKHNKSNAQQAREEPLVRIRNGVAQKKLDNIMHKLFKLVFPETF